MNTNKNKANHFTVAKEKVLKWKLACVMAALCADKKPVDLAVASTHGEINSGADVAYDDIQSAYFNACGSDKGLQKQLDRLGYLYLELLVLLNNLNLDINKATTSASDAKLLAASDVLATFPSNAQEYVTLEIRLRKTILDLLPGFMDVVKRNLYSEALQIRKAQVSNHVYKLIELGRKMTTREDRRGIEELIKNQTTLLERLASTTEKRLGSALERKILKVVHWQPQDLQDAERLYAESLGFMRELKLLPVAQQ